MCGFKSARGTEVKLPDWRQAEIRINLLISSGIIKCDGLRLKAKEELFFDSSKLIPDWGNYEPERLKKFLGEATREDVAAGAKRLEEVAVELISNALNKTGLNKVVLAGGVFANVLLNQKIRQLPKVDDIYIFPAMSDGGLAFAALSFLSKLKRKEGRKLMPKNFGIVYFGPSYSNSKIEEDLARNKIIYKKWLNRQKKLRS